MRNFLIVFILMIFAGCTSKDELRSTLSNIIGQRVCLCIDSMVIHPYENNKTDIKMNDSIPYKYVVYIDTLGCSMCTLEKVQLWNDFLPLEMEGKVRFYFIVESRKNEAESLFHLLSHVDLRHDIYIDTCQLFMHKNTFLPYQKVFHTMLLDEDNNVVLVGDPIQNEKIEKTMLKIVGVQSK